MTRCIRFLAASSLFSMTFALGGCSGGSSGPAIYPVKGVVTKGGQPLAGITVTFVNQEKKFLATGLTDEKGAFVLMSETGKSGTVDGKSKVTLSKAAASGATGNPSSDPGAYYQNMQKMREGGARGAPPKGPEVELPFSADYTDPEKSPVSFEVKAGTNEFEIPLP